MNKHRTDAHVDNGPAAEDGDRDSRVEPISKSKRALLKAGWVAPVIAVVSLPASGMVRCGSGCPIDD